MDFFIGSFENDYFLVQMFFGLNLHSIARFMAHSSIVDHPTPSRTAIHMLCLLRNRLRPLRLNRLSSSKQCVQEIQTRKRAKRTASWLCIVSRRRRSIVGISYTYIALHHPQTLSSPSKRLKSSVIPRRDSRLTIDLAMSLPLLNMFREDVTYRL
jgi:hypothetical protein